MWCDGCDGRHVYYLHYSLIVCTSLDSESVMTIATLFVTWKTILTVVVFLSFFINSYIIISCFNWLWPCNLVKLKIFYINVWIERHETATIFCCFYHVTLFNIKILPNVATIFCCFCHNVNLFTINIEPTIEP